MTGATSLSTTGMPVETEPLRVVEAAAGAEDGDRGFAILVAATVVERVWEEVFGSRLTLAHRYPRHPDQRSALYSLARSLVQSANEVGGPPWSLRYLLKTMLLRPEFNAATGVGEEYPLGVEFNPWELLDPRTTENDCGTTPTFEGCVRGLLRQHACARCHANPAQTAPDFSPTSYAEVAIIKFDGDIFCGTSPNACVAELAQVVPNFDCNTFAVQPGSEIARRVNCPDGNGSLMPPGVRMPAEDRAAIAKWVSSGGPQGTPFPPNEPTSDAQTHNGVGDRLQWKSPFQLTLTAGRALLDPATTDAWAKPFPAPSSGYPTVQVALLAGQYLDDGKPGGRGFSLLTFLDWERAHTSSEPCRVGTGPDRVDAMVTPGSVVMDLVAELKQSLLGESALDGFLGTDGNDEAALIDGVLAAAGVDLATVVSAGNTESVNSGLRLVCNVFLRSPLFMLAYLESPEEQLMALAAAASKGPGSSKKPVDVLPDLCNGRLDCRTSSPPLETRLDQCSQDRRTCTGSAGQALTDQVKRLLTDRRLPVEPPEIDLERARIELPAAVPSENDPRLSSSLLILPFDGGNVTRLSAGRLTVFSNGAFRELREGDTFQYGEVVFIRHNVRFSVSVTGQTYATDDKGMERPPERESDPGNGRHLGNQVWILLVNGAQARSAPHPARNPAIALGTSLGPPAVGPTDGLMPAWASFGEARQWYALPR